MANANLTMGVKGVDRTGAAFNSIKNRAKVTGAQIRAMMGGAIAAAGAYLSFRSIKGAIDEMRTINDVAMRANVSAEEVQKLTKALSILGIQGADVSSVATAMARMEKATGESGLKGFYRTIGAMGQLTSASERAQATIKVFGRSGLVFMPLVNAAKDGTNALQGVVDAFGGITNASAKSADDIADGVAIVTGTFKSLWYNALGTVAQWVTGEFGGSFRQSMMALSSWISYWARNVGDILLKPFLAFQKFFTSWYGALGALVGSLNEKFFGSGGSWGDVWDNVSNAFMEEWRELGMEYDAIDERMQKRADELAQKLDAARNFQANYDNAAMTTGERNALAEEIGTTAAKAAHRVTNQLMLAGSSAANRLSVLGPEYQNETKKQTDLLRKIAQNTEKTAENTDDMGDNYTPTDL